MYYVLEAILKYIQTAIVYRLGQEKLTLSIDTKHKQYMEQYKKVYDDYKTAHDLCDAGNYRDAIEKADATIQTFVKLGNELDQFRNDYSRTRTYITKGCRRIHHAFQDTTDQTCRSLFPNMTDWTLIHA
jgi:hypothetical protein